MMPVGIVASGRRAAAAPLWVAGTYIEDDTGTTPAHQIGDALVVVAFDGATIPSLPAGWINLATLASGSVAMRVGWKVATATNDATGVWTNAWAIGVGIWRGCTLAGAALVSNSTTLPALTVAAGNWVGAFGSGDAAPAVPSTMTSRLSATNPGGDAYRWSDTNGPVSTWASRTVANQIIGAVLRLVPTT